MECCYTRTAPLSRDPVSVLFCFGQLLPDLLFRTFLSGFGLQQTQVTVLPQVLKNVRVADKAASLADKAVQAAILGRITDLLGSGKCTALTFVPAGRRRYPRS